MPKTTDALRDRALKAREWMYESAFPLWAGRGIDADGYFFERLDRQGVGASDSRRRIRVQARQTFSFALACLLGWRKDRSAEIARHGAHVLLSRCAGADGLYGTWLDTRTGPIDAYCLYDCAFVLLALNWAAHALGDRVLGAEAGALAGRIDAVCRHPQGGYRETPDSSAARLQNPHMHLFEALLARASLTGDPKAIKSARGVETFVMERFFDARTGVLLEEWSETHRPIPARVEAGHHYEWTWLLHHHAGVSGAVPSPRAGALYRRGVALTGGDGRIDLAHTSDGYPYRTDRRMWCLCEAIKAHLVLAEQGQFNATPSACGSFDLLWSDHVRDDGSWIDTRDVDGNPTGDAVPASSGYHLYLALVCLMRAAGLRETMSLPIAPGFGSGV